MSVTININNLTLCHRASGGITRNTLPDVCKTPPHAVPVPFPNLAFSRDLANGTTTVFADGGNMIGNFGSIFATSILDEGGSLGGVKSGTFMAEADFITHSFDVFFEGKPACRLTDKMWMNHRNTVNMGGLEQIHLVELRYEICVAICFCKDKWNNPAAFTKIQDFVRELDAKASSIGNFWKNRQACFANLFSRGSPWYGTTPNDPRVLVEVPYKIAYKNVELIASETGRTTFPGGPVAPASTTRALSTASSMARYSNSSERVVIWDMVTLDNKNYPASWGNVDQAIEIKFDGDNLTANQKQAMENPYVKSKVVIVEEKECPCESNAERALEAAKDLLRKLSQNPYGVPPPGGHRGGGPVGPAPIPVPIPIIP